MNAPCGCCEGTEVLTPAQIANRPGLSALAYRIGTHATFLETMKARLSAAEFSELASLTTRAASDPAIAWLDAWATVADVLTFYQERIANEGYLRTATERRSILELARLVGYALRPGVAASVYLAYTLEKDQRVEIPEGAQAQSVPGPGELPETFETSEKLETRADWNNLAPRLTRPQQIRPENADVITTLYLAGTTTKLDVNDPLLLVFGNERGQQFLRRVETVEPVPAENRTKVTLQLNLDDAPFIRAVLQTVERFLDLESFCVSSDDGIVKAVVNVLNGLFPAGFDGNPLPNVFAAQVVLRTAHAQASERGNTEVAAWIEALLSEFAELLRGVEDNTDRTEEIRDARNSPKTVPASNTLTAFTGLSALIGPFAKPPSRQPASSVNLKRDVKETLSLKGDVAAQVLTKVRLKDDSSELYRAWGSKSAEAAGKVEVYALRVTAPLFGANAPRKILSISQGGVVETGEWPIIEEITVGKVTVRHEENDIVYLDANYKKVLPRSWVVVDTSAATRAARFEPERILIAKARDVKSGISRSEYNLNGPTTRIALEPTDDTVKRWANFEVPPAATQTQIADDFQLIRQTVVYAQSELLPLAEEPIKEQICGNRLELAQLYDGLQSGRWIIVSGERADLPGRASGMTASELVMLAGVTQGGAPSRTCAQFPLDRTPFDRVLYISDPNAVGDRLILGRLRPLPPPATSGTILAEIPAPSAPNQTYCSPIELAPGLLADAYVPTAQERQGNFDSFIGVSFTPLTTPPVPVVQRRKMLSILDRLQRTDPIDLRVGNLFLWRVPAQKLNSTLLLANGLAYVYKRNTVTIYGNVVEATHGLTRSEVLGSGDGSKALQKFDLRQSPVTFVAAPTTSGVETTLEVRVNDVKWQETRSLDALKPADRKYITRTDDKDQMSVIFGNGVRGARLPTGVENVTAVYRTGIGKPGNVKSGQITNPVTRPLGVKKVINPLRASGGADRESRDSARRNAPLAVMALDRLVSTKDYEDFARTFAGIGKTSAARLSDGQQQLVHLTIAGEGDIPIDVNSALYRNLVKSLHRFGDPFQAVQVDTRELMLLVISAKVRVLPEYLWEAVAPKIRAALLDTFGFDQRDLGQSVFLSEVISAIQRVEGVAYADLDVLDSVSETEILSPEELARKLNQLGTQASRSESRPKQFIYVRKAKPKSQARCGNVTATGICPAQLAFLSPDVPDTLILTELSA